MRGHEFLTETTALDKIKIDFGTVGFVASWPVNEVFSADNGNYEVTNMGMYVSLDPDAGGGDLGITYNVDGEDEEEMYPYGDDQFEMQVQQFLVKMGIPKQVAHGVTFSESGMQDVGRASCDAYELADYLRSLVLDAVKTPAEKVAIIKKFPGILLHVDHVDQQVANTCKTEIIKYCLGEFKSDNVKNAITVINTLKASGVDWPEFAAMEKSAGLLKNKI